MMFHLAINFCFNELIARITPEMKLEKVIQQINNQVVRYNLFFEA